MVLLTACGGGGSSTGSTYAPITPTQQQKSVAAFSFSIPAAPQGTTAQSIRTPQYISAGNNGLDFIEDGSVLVANNTAILNGGVVSGTTIATDTAGDTLTFGGYTYNATTARLEITLNLTTEPGPHTFGIAVRGGMPSIILGENQIRVVLPGHATTNVAFPLRGIVANAAIECPTVAENAAGNNCNNFQNLVPGNINGTYTFAAIAEDYEGFPIYQQLNPDGTTFVPYDNGTLTPVVVSGPATIADAIGSPWSTPGNALIGAPAGSWWETKGGLTFTYGNTFNVVCNGSGTAVVALQLSGTTPFGSTNPLTNETYVVNTDWPNVPSSGQLSAAYPNGATSVVLHNGYPNGIANIAHIGCGAANAGFTIY